MVGVNISSFESGKGVCYLAALVFLCVLLPSICLASKVNPYDLQVQDQLTRLKSPDANVRAGAAESLGYLRGYEASDALVSALADSNAAVRREAAMSLAWCGDRSSISALIEALDDGDWTVRQGAWVSLTNLTGMEFEFDGLAEQSVRRGQVLRWRRWWSTVPAGDAPHEVYQTLEDLSFIEQGNFAIGCSVDASTTYRGPASLLTDGDLGGAYWQTKNVAFPQHCTVDLGAVGAEAE